MSGPGCPCGPVLHSGEVIAHLDPAVPVGVAYVTVLDDPDDGYPAVCYCGDGADCWFWSDSYRGYLWCRPCGEHHRPPECAIDEQGRALNWEGVPWDDPPMSEPKMLKFNLGMNTGQVPISMPAGARVLSAAPDPEDDGVAIWAEVEWDTQSTGEVRSFWLTFTGQPSPPGAEFLATVIIRTLVWHVWVAPR